MSLRVYPDSTTWIPVFPESSGDPLAGLAGVVARWHNVSGSPAGLYTDVACTVPVTEEFQAVAGVRSVMLDNAIIATQANPDKRPLWYYNNSKAVLWYDGVDDVLAIEPSLISGATALAGFVGFIRTDDPPLAGNESGILDNWGTAPTSRDHLPWGGNLIFHGFGSTDRYNSIAYTEDLTLSTVATLISATNDWRLYLNSVLKHQSVSNTVGIGSAPMLGGNNGILPGGGATTATAYSGDICSLLAMTQVPTPEQRALVESYFQGLAP